MTHPVYFSCVFILSQISVNIPNITFPFKTPPPPLPWQVCYMILWNNPLLVYVVCEWPLIMEWAFNLLKHLNFLWNDWLQKRSYTNSKLLSSTFHVHLKYMFSFCYIFLHSKRKLKFGFLKNSLSKAFATTKSSNSFKRHKNFTQWARLMICIYPYLHVQYATDVTKNIPWLPTK